MYGLELIGRWHYSFIHAANYEPSRTKVIQLQNENLSVAIKSLVFIDAWCAKALRLEDKIG